MDPDSSALPLDSTLQALTYLGLLAGTIVAAVQAWQSKRQAKKAAAHSYPLSNGWGSQVGADLAAVRHEVLQIARRQTAADERDSVLLQQAMDAATHARTAAEQSAAVATGLAAHLADHARSDALADTTT